MSNPSQGPIPYHQLDTLFLDLGNTVMSMDFPWLREVLGTLGMACSVGELRRAEAAARPLVSKELERLKSTEARGTQRFYIRAMIGNLAAAVEATERLDEVSDRLVAALRAADTQRVWSYVLPGVPEALASLHGRGLRVVAVSNSDGTAESGLVELGLRTHFDAVIDSHLAGFEKPDPRLFRHALERCGALPERTLHVGDLYYADVLGARSAGIHALLLDPYGDWRAVDCECLPDLSSLARRFEQLGR